MKRFFFFFNGEKTNKKITRSHQLRDDLRVDLEPVDHESWKKKRKKRRMSVRKGRSRSRSRSRSR